MSNAFKVKKTLKSMLREFREFKEFLEYDSSNTNEDRVNASRYSVPQVIDLLEYILRGGD